MAFAFASTSGGTVVPLPPAPPLPPVALTPLLVTATLVSPPSAASVPALPLPAVEVVPPNALQVPALASVHACMFPLPALPVPTPPWSVPASPSSVFATLAQEAASGMPRVRYSEKARNCQVLVMGNGAAREWATARQPPLPSTTGTGSHREIPAHPRPHAKDPGSTCSAKQQN